MKYTRTFSEKETYEKGKELGVILNAGDVVCLDGELGAGKTVFAKGIAHSLGIDRHVTSPTFGLVNEYDGEIPLFHFDVYRIDDPEEMYEIGYEEYIYGNGVTLIEWAEKITDILPKDRIQVNIRKLPEKGLDTREITVEFVGDRYMNYKSKLSNWQSID